MSSSEIERRGLMLVLSSPSGAGKTTISRRLLEGDDGLILSVSVTTRAKRPDETDGIDYRFVDQETFDQMARRGELLEHARVFGHDYGTPRAPVEAALADGRDVIFDVDWQGARQLKKSMREKVVGVFVLPPSSAELESRLRGRAQDSPTVVADRMARAADEMSHWSEYDYVVVNDDLEASVARVRAILKAERLRRDRQTGLEGFVEGLRKNR